MANFNDLRSGGSDSNILGSIWTGLSPHLIARFYAVKKLPDGSEWEQSRDKMRELSSNPSFVVSDGFEVHCPITDGIIETTLNWQSPFEGAGPDSKAPALSAMLQSGSLTPVLQAAFDAFGIDAENTSADEILQKATGRTGITRLNSTQVFSGMPPVKMTLTLHFRALKDPVREVNHPLRQLKEWALPQFLADDSVIAGALKNGFDGDPMETIFPSKAPQILGMKYGDMTYAPIVIESISEPFTNPRSSDGAQISCSVQVTIATLTALDRRDIQKMYR